MSEIVYTPTSEYKKEYFTPQTKDKFLTYLTLFGKRITINISSVGSPPHATTDTYNVPDGKITFITNIFLISTSSAGHTASVYADGQRVIWNYHISSTGTLLSRQTAFLVPYMCQSKLIIDFSGGAGSTMNCAEIIAYEIDIVTLQNLK